MVVDNLCVKWIFPAVQDIRRQFVGLPLKIPILAKREI